jgi:hypothetical protein
MDNRLLHCIVHAFLWISVVSLIACDSKKNPDQRKYESSYNSNSTATESQEDRAYVDNSLNTGNSPYKSKEPSVEENPYYNNSLSTGSSPYSSHVGSVTGESQISVSTSASSNCDVVVIVKSRGRIARNAYIEAGNSYTFYVPNGTYQVFFYAGKGWNPNKNMPNGLKGGFVANESYSKDSPVNLEYQGLTYELILQPNGNFSTQQSSASEIF